MENMIDLRKSSDNSSKANGIIEKFDKPTVNSNIEIVTERKYAEVVVAGKITISIEDARGILHVTRKIKDSKFSDVEAIRSCMHLLNSFALGILITPTEESDIENIIRKY